VVEPARQGSALAPASTMGRSLTGGIGPVDASRRCGSTPRPASQERLRMCGIVGYVGPREARPLLLAGLEKLEYRGYDSAGISVLSGDRIDAVRAVGNLGALRRAMGDSESSGGAVAVAAPPQSGTGIG